MQQRLATGTLRRERTERHVGRKQHTRAVLRQVRNRGGALAMVEVGLVQVYHLRSRQAEKRIRSSGFEYTHKGST